MLKRYAFIIAAALAATTFALETDPLAPGATDFLDVKVGDYLRAAEAAYKDGRYADAATSYISYLHYNVFDETAIYNLACCYALMGEGDWAARALRQARAAGWKDVAFVEKDPDFDRVRDVPAFSAVVAEMKEEKGDAGRKVLYVQAPVLLPCYVKIPSDYDAAKAPTLVIGLHGLGSDGTQSGDLWDRFDNAGFIYATPQAPYPLIVGRRLGYSWGLLAGDEMKPAKDEAAAAVERYVVELVSALQERYGESDVYLLGFSQGSGLALRIGLKNPGLVKGVMCFSGHWSPDWLPAEPPATPPGLRVFLAHGRADPVVSFEESDAAYANLTSASYDVTFRPFEGVHEVPTDVLREAQAWMAVR